MDLGQDNMRLTVSGDEPGWILTKPTSFLMSVGAGQLISLFMLFVLLIGLISASLLQEIDLPRNQRMS